MLCSSNHGDLVSECYVLDSGLTLQGETLLFVPMRLQIHVNITTLM